MASRFAGTSDRGILGWVWVIENQKLGEPFVTAFEDDRRRVWLLGGRIGWDFCGRVDGHRRSWWGGSHGREPRVVRAGPRDYVV